MYFLREFKDERIAKLGAKLENEDAKWNELTSELQEENAKLGRQLDELQDRIAKLEAIIIMQGNRTQHYLKKAHFELDWARNQLLTERKA